MRQVARAPYSLLLLIALTLALSSCITRTSTDPREPAPAKARPSDDVIATTPMFSAVYDAFIERRNVGSCETGSCNLDDYDIIDDCTYFPPVIPPVETGLLILRYWGSSYCAQTNLLMDFDTRPLPDSSVIDDVRLQLYLLEVSETDVGPSQPNEQGCTEPGTAAPLATMCGTFYIATDSTGRTSLTSSNAIPQYPCPTSKLTGAWLVQSLGTGTLPRWVDLLVDNKISLTKFSRYGIDKDYVGNPNLVELFFASGDNGPQLRVKYHVPFAAWADGGIEHTLSNCASCSTSAFTSTTSGPSAIVGRDLNQTGLCGEAQAVVAFDTAELIDDHVPSSATIEFYVNNNVLEEDVSTRRVRIYAKKETGSGTSVPAPTDFNGGGCASGFNNLGTVTLNTTGAKSFAITNPDSNINETGITRFVFVDDSSFSSPTGYCFYSIHLSHHGLASTHPKLTINYQ